MTIPTKRSRRALPHVFGTGLNGKYPIMMIEDTQNGTGEHKTLIGLAVWLCYLWHEIIFDGSASSPVLKS